MTAWCCDARAERSKAYGALLVWDVGLSHGQVRLHEYYRVRWKNVCCDRGSHCLEGSPNQATPGGTSLTSGTTRAPHHTLLRTRLLLRSCCSGEGVGALRLLLRIIVAALWPCVIWHRPSSRCVRSAQATCIRIFCHGCRPSEITDLPVPGIHNEYTQHVPVKRHRGEPGHTRDTNVYATQP